MDILEWVQQWAVQWLRDYSNSHTRRGWESSGLFSLQKKMASGGSGERKQRRRSQTLFSDAYWQDKRQWPQNETQKFPFNLKAQSDCPLRSPFFKISKTRTCSWATFLPWAGASWTRWSPKVPSDLNDSVVLWFCDRFCTELQQRGLYPWIHSCSTALLPLDSHTAEKWRTVKEICCLSE